MKNLVIVILLLVCAFLFFRPTPNSKPTYGDTGLPKNCRAIVAQNIEDYQLLVKSRVDGDTYNLPNSPTYQELYDYAENLAYYLEKVDGQFQSLDRNCGAYGYSWEYR